MISEATSLGTCPICGSGSKVVGKVSGVPVLTCTACAHSFTASFPPSQSPSSGSISTETEDSFTQRILEVPAHVASRMEELVNARVQRYEELLGTNGSISVLEVGCGSGEYGRIYERKSHRYFGVDLDERVIESGQRRGANIRNVDVMDLVDESYDVIFLSQVLEHITRPTEFLRKLRSLLKSPGVLHLDVPNHLTLAGVPSRLRRGSGPRLGGIDYPHHCMSYTPKSLGTLLQSTGPWKEVDVFTATPDDPVWGQAVVPTSRAKSYYRASTLLHAESLVVAVAVI